MELAKGIGYGREHAEMLNQEIYSKDDLVVLPMTADTTLPVDRDEAAEDVAVVVQFILNQLAENVSEEKCNTPGWIWNGPAVKVGAKDLNPIIRALEAVGEINHVVIFPDTHRYTRGNGYILKLYAVGEDPGVPEGLMLTGIGLMRV